MRRMDRYQDETPTRMNRLEKNQDLYQDLANNTKYTNITDVTNVNAYELNSKRDEETSSREKYQQMRKYNGIENVPKVKKELDDFNYLYPKKEKRIYDINSVLEEARRNRQEKDALEEKRKLKYTSYNIFSGVNLEELAKYREEKKKRDATPEEKEIHQLMDTIASKTLAGEISKEETVELLSDLMATSIMDKVNPAEELGKEEPIEILETHTIVMEQKAPQKEEEEKTNEITFTEDSFIHTNQLRNIQEESEKEVTEENKKIDDSFYTKSMDLSDNDFEMAEDFQDKGLPTIVKVLIVLLIIAIVVVAGYFIYLRLN